MDYRRVGRSGLKVSEICLGTMTFGHGTGAAEAERIVQAALDAGVNFFDTADGYGGGEFETMLGRALGKRRRETVIATKVFAATGSGPNDFGMSRVHIMQAVEDSLRRLGTNWIDLYYIHHVDIQAPLEEMLRAFDDLVRQGKIRYTACSNYEAWRLMETLWISDSKGLARFEAYQPQYSLVVRDVEEEWFRSEPEGARHGGLGAARRRLSFWEVPTGSAQFAGLAFGRELGFPDPVLPCEPRGDSGRASHCRRRARSQPCTSSGAMGAGAAARRQRHRWRPHGGAAYRHARCRRLGTTCRNA